MKFGTTKFSIAAAVIFLLSVAYVFANIAYQDYIKKTDFHNPNHVNRVFYTYMTPVGTCDTYGTFSEYTYDSTLQNYISLSTDSPCNLFSLYKSYIGIWIITTILMLLLAGSLHVRSSSISLDKTVLNFFTAIALLAFFLVTYNYFGLVGLATILTIISIVPVYYLRKVFTEDWSDGKKIFVVITSMLISLIPVYSVAFIISLADI